MTRASTAWLKDLEARRDEYADIPQITPAGTYRIPDAISLNLVVRVRSDRLPVFV